MFRIPSKLLKPRSNLAGFTIIESLVAIVVVAILVTAVSPAITLSVAMRVQAKRVEQATQAARTYLDGVRSYNATAGTGILPPNHTIILGTTGTPASNAYRLTETVGAPSQTSIVGSCARDTNGYCTGINTTAGSLYCVDRDGGGCSVRSNQDFVIQAFRSANVDTTNATNAVNLRTYILGIRVYRADAFNTARNSNPLRCNAVTAGCNNTAGRKTTQQTGYNIGDTRRGSPLISSKAPLVELVTEVSDANDSTFRDFCNRLSNTSAPNAVGGTTVTCP